MVITLTALRAHFFARLRPAWSREADHLSPPSGSPSRRTAAERLWKRIGPAATVLAVFGLIAPCSLAHAAPEAAPATTPASPPTAPAQPVYQNPSAPVAARVDDLFSRLTQDEKLHLLTTDAGHWYSVYLINIPGIPRLGIRDLRTTDGPEGLRVAPTSGFPMGATLASTWDPDIAYQVGDALGEEARSVDRQVVYGPSINIQRTPQSGRFFENMSEDPFLTSQMAVAYVKGMQSEGVAACPKHYFGNNQEALRHSLNVTMDERAMHEIYLPAFHACVADGHAWSIMAAVTAINGTRVVESHELMTDLLKKHWNWDGCAIADWSALHNTAASLNAGVDMDIPVPRTYSADNIAAALSAGTVTQATFDQAVKNVLRLIIRTGCADDPEPSEPPYENNPAHNALALKAAEEGIILLKNDGSLLPLDRTKIKTIAVIGPNAADTQLGGRWSADTPVFYKISMLEGIQNAAGPGIQISYEQGCRRIEPSDPAQIQRAVDLASKCDVAIVVPGTEPDYIGEEIDPPNLYLPGDQDQLIAAVAAANKNTIVVLNNGGPLLMDKWLPQVPALIEGWYAGQEQGNAVGHILFGDVNPSGKLTATIAAHREDYSDWGYYPGVNEHGPDRPVAPDDNILDQVVYAEGIYVGYRHFDKANIKPLFPFGFGLSYTTFAYGGLHVPHLLRPGQTEPVTLTVTNTGTRAGDEIVELYTHDMNTKMDRPVRELKGFKRVHLAAGASAQVSIPLSESSFAYYDTAIHDWKVNPGLYTVQVGASSRDIRLESRIHIK